MPYPRAQQQLLITNSSVAEPDLNRTFSMGYNNLLEGRIIVQMLRRID